VRMKFLDLSDGKYFLVKCSDWSAVIQADNETDACTNSLRNMIDKHGGELKLSSVIISQELNPDIFEQLNRARENEDLDYDEDPYDEYVSYHSVAMMLANAGMHDLSSNVKTIFGA